MFYIIVKELSLIIFRVCAEIFFRDRNIVIFSQKIAEKISNGLFI